MKVEPTNKKTKGKKKDYPAVISLREISVYVDFTKIKKKQWKTDFATYRKIPNKIFVVNQLYEKVCQKEEENGTVRAYYWPYQGGQDSSGDLRLEGAKESNLGSCGSNVGERESSTSEVLSNSTDKSAEV